MIQIGSGMPLMKSAANSYWGGCLDMGYAGAGLTVERILALAKSRFRSGNKPILIRRLLTTCMK